MPILFESRLPFRPPGVVVLEAAHPSAVGLLRAYMGDGILGRYDWAHQQHGTLTASPKVAGLPGIGSGFYCTGGASLDIPSDWPVTGADYSWRLVFTPRSWTGSFTAVIDGAAREMAIFFNTSGDINFSGGAGSFVQTALGLTAGQRWDLVVTHDANGTRTFVNARQIGSALPFDPGLGSVNETLSIGRNASGGGTDADLIFESFQLWDRALTLTEIKRLNAPATQWDLYRVPSTRVFFDVGAAQNKLLLRLQTEGLFIGSAH